MPNWSDDEGRCHFEVNGVPCYQSAVDKCPAHGGMARVRRDECEHGSLRRKCQRCADRTELNELRADNKRLREALRKMVDAHGDSEGATPNRRRQCSCSACDAARAALAGKEKP